MVNKLTDIIINSISLVSASGDERVDLFRRASRGRPRSPYAKIVEKELKLDNKTTPGKLVSKYYAKARADKKSDHMKQFRKALQNERSRQRKGSKDQRIDFQTPPQPILLIK